MATSSISADVKAANSKLATYLRRIEEQEQGLQIGRRKPKKLQEEKLPAGAGRWRLEPDYRAPSPMVDRPRTRDGSTSFHFSFSSFSKEVVPTVGGKPVDGAFGKAKNGAVEHSKYIEREGAAEVVLGAEHAQYIERPGAVEIAASERDNELGIVFTEEPSPEEAALLGPIAEELQGVPSIFSNISTDPFMRHEFWRAVDRCEANPQTHDLIVDPTAPDAFFQELEASSFVDASFRDHALSIREQYRQHQLLHANAAPGEKPFTPRPFKGSQERLGRVIEQLQQIASYDPRNPPIRFKSGRGGRIQFRMVAELPHELSAADRALIVQNFCDHLAGLEERRNAAGELQKVGMMYTAVIHAPDSHNDSRNYHLHVVAYDRPCRYMPELGVWDFEAQEVYVDPGSRKERVRHPFRQNKIGEVSQGREKTGKAASGVDFIPQLRRQFADITNAVLQARGIARRYDPRRYSEMGIDRTPTAHLGTKAAALESIGVATQTGLSNAAAIWSDAERSVRRLAVETSKSHRAAQAEFKSVQQRSTAANVTGSEASRFRALLIERDGLIKDIADDREAIMSFDLMEAKAKSRAVRTRQTCLQFLADIEAGRADHTTRIMRAAIEDRWRGAQAHIEAIDRDLAPHRPALAKAAESVEKREQRVAEIDQSLVALRNLLEAKIAAAGEQKAGRSKATAARPPAPTATPDAYIVPPRAPASISEPTAPAQVNEPVTPEPSQVDKGRVDSRDPDVAQPAPNEPQPSAPADIKDLGPVTIEGLPVAEPTLGARQDIQGPELDAKEGVPSGLNPVRSPEPEELPAPSTISEIDLEPSSSTAQAEPQNSGPAAPEPITQQANQNGEKAASTVPDNGPGEDEQTTAPDTLADASRVDPKQPDASPADAENATLFPLPEQPAPAKHGSSKSDYADFDALLNRIANERIQIEVKKVGQKVTYSVPRLPEAEQQMLRSPRFKVRADKRLAGIQTLQANEVNRAVRWVKQTGQDPAKLILENRRARLGPTVPKAIHTLFKHWASHPDVLDALRAEHGRRQEVAAQASATKDRAPTPGASAIRLAEAWPDLATIEADQVRDFVQLLRSNATDEQLRRAAALIQRSAGARADVMKHGVDVATAYETHRPKEPPSLKVKGKDQGQGL